MSTINTIKLDTEWNVSVENGRLVIISNLDALTQYIKQRLLVFKGEYFLDINRGVDYENILGSKNQPDDSEFIDVINDTGYGVNVVEFEQTINTTTRQLSVTFTAESDYGTLSDISVGV